MEKNPPIEGVIDVALPNGGGAWVDDPKWIMNLPEPAWAKMGRLRKVYQELKAARESWLKVPAKEMAKIAKRDRLGIMPFRLIDGTAARMRALERKVLDEIGDMARRLTRKDTVRHADVALLLTTRCGWSQADVRSATKLEEIAATLFAALPALDDHAPYYNSRWFKKHTRGLITSDQLRQAHRRGQIAIQRTPSKQNLYSQPDAIALWGDDAKQKSDNNP